MNWAQFKDPTTHMCLAGVVVASWSLTQEVAGSNPFTVMKIIFITELSKFSETFRKNSITSHDAVGNASAYSPFKIKLNCTATDTFLKQSNLATSTHLNLNMHNPSSSPLS